MIARWKLFVALLTLFTAYVVFSEVYFGIAKISSGVRGGFGYQSELASPDGERRFRITAITPGSPMERAGARVGDLIRQEDVTTRWYRFSPGEESRVTLFQGGEPRTVTLVAQSTPLTFDGWIAFPMFQLANIISLVLGAIVGWRKPEGKQYRALALYLLLLTLYNFAPYTPHGMGRAVVWWSGIGAFALMKVFLVRYALYVSGPVNTGLRGLLQRYEPVVIAAMLLHGAAIVIDAAGYNYRWAQAYFNLFSILIPAVIVLLIFEGWRKSEAEKKRQHLWLLVALVLSGATPILSLASTVPIGLFGLQLNLGVVAAASGCLQNILLAYAALRHRVLDMSFAISRTLVFSITSVILILVFFLFERTAHHFVHFEDAGKSALFDGFVAFTLFFVFNRLHHRVEHAIEKTLFHEWRSNAAALDRFVAKAAHFSDATALVSAFSNELDRFTGTAGNALYRLRSDGEYKTAVSSMKTAPATVDANDDLIISLLLTREPMYVSDTLSSLPGESTYPMFQGARLIGFVLLGAKSNGQAYRPDETVALASAVNKIGLDLFALRVAELEGINSAMTQRATLSEAQLAIMEREAHAMRSAFSVQMTAGEAVRLN